MASFANPDKIAKCSGQTCSSARSAACGCRERVHRDDEDADGCRRAQARDEDALFEGLAREKSQREREREAIDEHRAGGVVERGSAPRDAKREDRGRQDDGGERDARSEPTALVAQRREDDREAARDERDRDERDGRDDRERDCPERAVVRLFSELRAERGEKPQPRAHEDHRGRGALERARLAGLLRHASEALLRAFGASQQESVMAHECAKTFARETRERNQEQHRSDREAAEREPRANEIDAAFVHAERGGRRGEERRDCRDGDGAAESREEAHQNRSSVKKGGMRSVASARLIARSVPRARSSATAPVRERPPNATVASARSSIVTPSSDLEATPRAASARLRSSTLDHRARDDLAERVLHVLGSMARAVDVRERERRRIIMGDLDVDLADLTGLHPEKAPQHAARFVVAGDELVNEQARLGVRLALRGLEGDVAAMRS